MPDSRRCGGRELTVKLGPPMPPPELIKMEKRLIEKAMQRRSRGG